MVVLGIQSLDEFNAKLQEAGDKIVVVDFFATWCGPCKAIKPDFAALSEEFTDMIFCSVDVDEVQDIAESKGVSALPTFLIFMHGVEEKKVIGAKKSELESAIKEVRNRFLGAPGSGAQCQRPM
ncbi:thioredoxin-like [Hypanus sabinus]|uniref:thioredoxin-like n=1 Tax=Hypanus sabinus TaxID=79690 RepID=UPI0028C4F14D|nr:thioredoxin-like [Hypanus sabinus]